jgi:hypothetical protein
VPECPICSSPVQDHGEGVAPDWSTFACPRCGRWQIDTDSGGITLLLARKIGAWDAQALRRRVAAESHLETPATYRQI